MEVNLGFNSPHTTFIPNPMLTCNKSWFWETNYTILKNPPVLRLTQKLQHWFKAQLLPQNPLHQNSLETPNVFLNERMQKKRITLVSSTEIRMVKIVVSGSDHLTSGIGILARTEWSTSSRLCSTATLAAASELARRASSSDWTETELLATTEHPTSFLRSLKPSYSHPQGLIRTCNTNF
jgi:hypothetical protein